MLPSRSQWRASRSRAMSGWRPSPRRCCSSRSSGSSCSGARRGAGTEGLVAPLPAVVGGVSAVVFVLLWLPVAYGTIVDSDGNLGRLFDFFFTQNREKAGFKMALEVMGLQWGPRPEWILGPRGIAIFGNMFVEPRWWAVIWLVLGAAAIAVAIRRRDVRHARGSVAAMIVVGLVAAIYAVSNIVDVVFPYLNRWTWVLGAAMGMLVLQGLWLAVPPGAPRRRCCGSRLRSRRCSWPSSPRRVDQGDRRRHAVRQAAGAGARDHPGDPRQPPAGQGEGADQHFEGGTDRAGHRAALERRGIPVELLPSPPSSTATTAATTARRTGRSSTWCSATRRSTRSSRPDRGSRTTPRPLLAEDRQTIEKIIDGSRPHPARARSRRVARAGSATG